MFGRILVATDLTPITRSSLRAALELARKDDGEVLLLHVIRRIPGIPDRELRDFYDRLKANARVRMHELTSWFTRERGIEIVCEVAIGQPAQEIARIAQKRGVDLVVLAHGDDDAEAPLGSVSYKVARLAKCAALMLKVPGRAKPVAARRAAPTIDGPLMRGGMPVGRRGSARQGGAVACGETGGSRAGRAPTEP